MPFRLPIAVHTHYKYSNQLTDALSNWGKLYLLDWAVRTADPTKPNQTHSVKQNNTKRLNKRRVRTDSRVVFNYVPLVLEVDGDEDHGRDTFESRTLDAFAVDEHASSKVEHFASKNIAV